MSVIRHYQLPVFGGDGVKEYLDWRVSIQALAMLVSKDDAEAKKDAVALVVSSLRGKALEWLINAANVLELLQDADYTKFLLVADEKYYKTDEIAKALVALKCDPSNVASYVDTFSEFVAALGDEALPALLRRLLINGLPAQ
jgi:hypothetical protein